jgi:monoamine oxidase
VTGVEDRAETEGGAEVDLDVAVVGAGISGLAVAHALTRLGKSVRVFEARSRLGGRIESVPAGDGMADLGPTWFWPGEERVRVLAEELGLGVYDHWNQGDAVMFSNGTPVRARDYTVPRSFRFAAGAGALVDGLAARLGDDVVELNTPVSRVYRNGSGVALDLTTNTLRARAVVVALPPPLALSSGMVLAGDLHPSVQQVAQQTPVWMGGIVKAVARYAQPFWRDAGLSGLASYLPGPFGEIHDMSGPGGTPAMLFGFGQASPDRSDITAEGFVEELALLFGPAAREPVEVFTRDWSAEEWTTPRHAGSGRYDLYGARELQEPSWDGRLWWSSTETSSVAPGHLEGALAAAERTVAGVTDHLAS